jgi:hypothetical protein
VASCVTWTLCVGARGDPGFIRYDANARRVDLTLIATYDKSNSGGAHGAHRVTVPTGWRVRLTFVNRDVIRHSVVAVREQVPLPMRIARPALSGAASSAIEQGLPAGARQDDIVFIATLPGEYLIACGVPGNVALGAYLRLTVSSGARVPTYRLDSASAF